MNINLTINEKKFNLDVDPDEKLLTLLRKENFFSVKSGCETGHCGSCTVLLDGKAVNSCLIPCGILNNSTVITLEHFKTFPVYQEISKSFEKAGISLCGFCDAGKYFVTYEIISKISNPTRDQIYEMVFHLKDCCVEKDILINGIIYSSQLHFEKEKLARKNGR